MLSNTRTWLVHLSIAASLVLAWSACSSGGSNSSLEPPSGIEAVSGDGQITLSWTAQGASDVNGYNVYRLATSFEDVSEATSINGASPVGGPSLTDSDVANGTKYFYRLTAVSANGNESGPSEEVEATPFPGPPDRP
jgi:fibronectin type 3 domain-containing protein